MSADRRFALGGRALRVHAARGTIVNAAFLVGVNGLGVLRGFVVAAFLSPDDYGVWGIIVVALGTLSWLKQVGLGEKFVQQDEEDQETEFQRAFTLEVVANALFLVALVAAIPAAVALYGEDEIVAPALAVAAVVPAYALFAPVWVFYRRMDFVRQRLLQSVDPVLGFVVAVALAAAGAGYWAFVVSMLVGTWANALVVWRWSPYPLRLRWDLGTARRYFSFSWPLFVAGASATLIAQATVVATSRAVGLAGVGALALSSAFGQWAHKVDQILTDTLYPAICAVQDRLDVLAEVFVKSNRLTLMWGAPVGAGVALFVADLVEHALGAEWRFAVTLMQVTAVVAAVNHVGFNWEAFYRARADTRPIATNSALILLVFLAGPIPLVVTHGLDGYAVGLLVAAAAALAIRGYYLRRLFRGFGILRHALRGMAPTLPGVGAVLLARWAEPFDRGAWVAVAELAVFMAVVGIATWLLERALLREALGYLRGGSPLAAGVPPSGP